MKNYFYEHNGELIESDEPFDVASKLLELADTDEELQYKILKLIIENMVNEEETEKPRQYSPYEEAFNHYFDEGMEKYKELFKE